VSNFEKCSICGRYDLPSRHRCPPAWVVRFAHAHPDEVGDQVYASDAEQAAEIFAELYDWESEEFNCAKGHPMEVAVRLWREPNAKPQIFVVTGEMVPQYRARLKEKSDEVQ
jgi:hypothetical protein